MSITKKIVTALVLLIAVSTGITYFVATYEYSNALSSTLKGSIKVAQENFVEMTQAKSEEFTYISQLASNYSGLADAVLENNKINLAKIANQVMQESSVSLVAITDSKGTVLFRGHSDTINDNISNQEVIKEGLAGRTKVAIVQTSSDVFALRSTSPIYQNNEVVGTISVGTALNNPDYLDWLGNLLDVQVTFFSGDTRLMTTIKKSTGERIVGTKLNNPLIEEKVLKKGEVYFGSNNILGEDYLSAYWPARSYNNDIVGIWFIGLPTSLALEAQIESAIITTISALVVFAIMVIIAAVLGLRFSAPIKRIARYSKLVSEGENPEPIRIDSKDEFETLADSLNAMVANLKEQAHWYKSVLDALPINVSVTDMDRKWILVNKAGLRGTNKNLEDIIGLECSTRAGNLCNTPECGITKLEQGIPEAINTMPNGTVMRMLLSYLLDSRGNKIGHVEVGLNITSEVQAREEAAQVAEKVKLNLIAQLEDVVQALNEASSELALAVNTAEGDAKNTAAHMIKVATAMHEIELTVDDVAKNASHAATNANDTQTQAEDGNHAVQDIVSDIQSVQSSSDTLKVNMEELSSHAESIGAILSIIRDIADQTNLLALNAAIEAARAGESGRGFAVVADEVRKLAEKTMTATKDVESAIEIIQSHTVESSKTMDSTLIAVRKASDEVHHAGETLSGIVDLSVSTAEEIAAIATAAEEQAMTTKDITSTISESSELAQKLSGSMSDALETVNKVSSQATMINDILRDMKSSS